MSFNIKGLLQNAADNKEDNTKTETTKAKLNAWKPLRSNTRRITLLVDANERRLSQLRNSLNALQKTIQNKMPNAPIKFQVGWFMDHKMEFTTWSDNPRDVGDITQRAHCVQGRSNFVAAFQDIHRTNGALSSDNFGDQVDIVLIAGDRMDDDPEELSKALSNLKKDETKIITCQIGHNFDATNAYETMAEETGGVYLPINTMDELEELVPIAIDTLLDDTSGQKLLANPTTESGQKLLQELEPKDP